MLDCWSGWGALVLYLVTLVSVLQCETSRTGDGNEVVTIANGPVSRFPLKKLRGD